MKKQYLAIALLGFATFLNAEDSKNDKKKDSSTVVREGIIGNVKVTAKGRNIDESPQRTEWKKRWAEQRKHRGSEDKEEEEDDSSEVSVTFKWPAKD